ncbi:metalloproteinase inhibitor 1-like [Diadema antillarum]|uniref:metalloproteinase inhibitor 1-like n=1 Tax=Diadema antillarum TaxID=105358 RepID=UPI003A8C7C89
MHQQRLWFFCNLLLLLLALLHFSNASDDVVCTGICPIVHPQQHFCNADLAFKLMVTGRAHMDSDFRKVDQHYSTAIRYRGVIIDTFKGPSSAREGMEVDFYTPRWECEIPIPEMDVEYLIAGKVRNGVLNVTECDGLAVPWSHLTSEQRAGIEGKYNEQCKSCEISSARVAKRMWGELVLAGQESGFWSTDLCFFNPIQSQKYGGKDCETLYSVCTPSLEDNGGTCAWEQTASYTDCFQKREDLWFFMEKSEPAFNCESDCHSQPSKKLRWQCTKQKKKLKRRGQCS